MTRVASSARIRLQGFNTEGINEHSPLEDQVALTYKAAYHYAGVNNFAPYTHRGIPGRAGPMVMKRITEALFPSADSLVRDKINGLVTQVLRKTDAAVCIKHPDSREQFPEWFVANSMPPNLTIVALSHSSREQKQTLSAEERRLVPTHREMKLTAQEAGEDLPPGEVTVIKPANPPLINPSGGHEVPAATIDAFKEQNLRIQQQHTLLVEEVYQCVVANTPIAGAEARTLLPHLMDGPSGTAITDAVRELERAGRLVSRIEEDDERLIRGGGSLPKGRRVLLWGPSPGPVPHRTALPPGVEPKKGAAEWARETKAQLDTWCDAVLDVLNAKLPKHAPRPRSMGKITEASGLTRDQTQQALDRLVKLNLIYKNDNYCYFLTERRQAPRPATAEPVIPPYANGSADQEAAREAVEVSQSTDVGTATGMDQPTPHVNVPPDDLASEIAALIVRHGGGAEVTALREKVAELESTVARQAKQIMALKGAIAAFEE